ncbi:hypothetical protein ACF0H5_023622 [Mactra antiquata]
MEDLSLKKSQFEYTIEMNEGIDSEMLKNNPELNKVLVESKQTFVMQRKLDESKNRSSDYMYVLENNNNSSNGGENIQNSSKEGNNIPETSAVLDLSGCNKRKRKSEVLTELPSLEESNLVIDEEDNSDNNDLDEGQPRKIHVTDKMITDSSSEGKMSPDSGVGNLNGDISDDGALDFSMTKTDTKQVMSPVERTLTPPCDVIDFSMSKVKSDSKSSQIECSTPISYSKGQSQIQTSSTPNVSFSTLSVTSASSIPSSNQSKKNRRKRSVPVRCERNIDDVSDIVQDYSVKPELVNDISKTDNDTKKIPEEINVKDRFQPSDVAPIDLTPKSIPSSKQLSLPSYPSIAPKSVPTPVDLSAKKSPTPVMTKPSVKEVPASPVDLSAASAKKANIKPTPMMPGLPFPGMMGNQTLDPLQMRHMFEMMYQMSPNHNMVQAQLMQFHALLQNSMMSNRLAQMNTLNAMKSAGTIKNDKNDNIIKAENDSSNDSVESELQKYSMNFMQKNGLMNNSLSPQGMSPMLAGQAFTPSPNSFRGKPGRRKTKDILPAPDSSPSSPKVDSKLPPIEFDSNASMDQVIDTLQKFFPIMSNNSDVPKSVSETGTRFFVKDNDQIQIIVNSLLNVGVLDLHEQELQGGEPVYKYICRVCNQTFFHVEHLTKHVKKQHIVKKYQCTECDRSFHDAGNYRQHMRVHDDNDIPYECDVCNRRFRHKCTLKVHMRIHTGEKPFKCDVCGATFKISSGLQTHMRKHTGETPYACEYCDLRFKCQSNLKQHLFQHTQVRPFPCDICGKTYSRKSIRDAHLLTHAKEYIKNGITDISQVPMSGDLSPGPMGGDMTQVPMTVGGME